MKTTLDTSRKSLTLTSLLTDFKEITKAGLAVSVVFSSIVGYLLGVLCSLFDSKNLSKIPVRHFKHWGTLTSGFLI